MTGPDSARDTIGPTARELPGLAAPPQDTWSNSTVTLAAGDLARELPQIPPEAIATAAATCRRTVPTAAGAGALRHCIRRRALGLEEGVPAAETGHLLA